MRVRWTPGPPPSAGRWWICWRPDGETETEVVPIEIRPSVINPNGRLLMTTMSGVAYVYEPNRESITHHARMHLPDPPSRRLARRP